MIILVFLSHEAYEIEMGNWPYGPFDDWANCIPTLLD